jgi:hypothetical protein
VGRFSLKRFVNVLVRPASDEVQLITEPDPTWQAWAADHGFTYRLDGSDLAGRLFDPPPDRHGMGDQYYGVVEGTWNGSPFTFFQHKTWNVGGPRGRRPQFAGAIVVRLPGVPRPDLLGVSPDEAFKAAGGELPHTGSFEWRTPDLLFGHGDWLDPSLVEGVLERITLQLSVAPAELWES